jgi:hypothetical protein
MAPRSLLAAKSLKTLRREVGKGVAVQICQLAPSVYWSLTIDEDWQAHCAEMENNVRELISMTEESDENGDIICTRVSRCTAQENPIPKSLRSMAGSDTLSYEITERWWKNRWDEGHKSVFSTVPSVLPDRIKISGCSWAEERSSTESALFSETHVKVSIFGLGDRIARGIEQGAAKAFANVPSRAEAFVAARSAPTLQRARTERSGTRVRQAVQALYKAGRLAGAVRWSRVRGAVRQGQLRQAPGALIATVGGARHDARRRCRGPYHQPGRAQEPSWSSQGRWEALGMLLEQLLLHLLRPNAGPR